MNIRKKTLVVLSALAILVSFSQESGASSALFENVSAEKSSFRVIERAPKAKFSDALASRVALTDAGAPKSGVWTDLIDIPTSGSPYAILEAVQSDLNAFEYIEDGRSGTPSDHWSRPAEFLARKGGDCEDFAIAKYAALAELGFSIDDMAVMVYIDRARAVVHAVLLVNVDDETYVLDSLNDKVVPLDRAGLGRPLYVVNENKSAAFL